MQVSQVSFGKIYRSEVQVKNVQTGEYEPMYFVEYENNTRDKYQLEKYRSECEDEDDFSRETDYSDDIVGDYLFCYEAMQKSLIGKRTYFYGIEDLDENIQCLCEVEKERNSTISRKLSAKDRKKPLHLAYLGVRPKNFYNRKDREYSRLGVNMVKELTKIAKKNNNGYIWLTSGNDLFWKKIPYAKQVEGLGSVRAINKNDYEACAKELDLMV